MNEIAEAVATSITTEIFQHEIQINRFIKYSFYFRVKLNEQNIDGEASEEE